MSKSLISKLKVLLNSLIALFLVIVVSSVSTTPAMAFAGTLENGNLAYAQGSGFDKGEACNYLPGFETGYDAWHFVLTSRGATFQQSATNPAVAINLNFVFMRQDGSLFVIKSGAWVQTGKGAYTYTRVEDKIRMVQAGTVAQINGLDSGMRLSHTCPGTGSAPAATTSPSPSPTATTATASPTPSPTPTATATRSASPSPTPTPSPTATRSASPTPSPTPSSTPTPTPTATPSPTPTPSSTTIPTLRPRPNPTASAIQVHPTGRRNPLPTPSPTPQSITPTPSPTASPSPSTSPTSSPSPTATSSASPSPSAEPTLAPPVLPTPPVVKDPENIEYVEPQTPKTLDPQKFPDPPASVIEITQEPKYGTVQINDNGTITYTPAVQTKPVVDVVEFAYTNLTGATVVVRKEFVVIQKGDVPSIIQTGPTSHSNNGFLLAGLMFALLGLVTVQRRSHE